jgi:hypothetical protein
MAIMTRINSTAATLSVSMSETLPCPVLPIWSVIFPPLRMRMRKQSGAILDTEGRLTDPEILLRYCHLLGGPAMDIATLRAWERTDRKDRGGQHDPAGISPAGGKTSICIRLTPARRQQKPIHSAIWREEPILLRRLALWPNSPWTSDRICPQLRTS